MTGSDRTEVSRRSGEATFTHRSELDRGAHVVVGEFGEPRPPYQFYCDRHLDAGERSEKVPFLDRLMRKFVGR